MLKFIRKFTKKRKREVYMLDGFRGCIRRGLGSAFVKFYEEYAIQKGCSVLRMDTNERNTIARKLYRKLGYLEAGIVPCEFNGIPGVNLVLLEKKL